MRGAGTGGDPGSSQAGLGRVQIPPPPPPPPPPHSPLSVAAPSSSPSGGGGGGGGGPPLTARYLSPQLFRAAFRLPVTELGGTAPLPPPPPPTTPATGAASISDARRVGSICSPTDIKKKKKRKKEAVRNKQTDRQVGWLGEDGGEIPVSHISHSSI